MQDAPGGGSDTWSLSATWEAWTEFQALASAQAELLQLAVDRTCKQDHFLFLPFKENQPVI